MDFLYLVHLILKKVKKPLSEEYFLKSRVTRSLGYLQKGVLSLSNGLFFSPEGIKVQPVFIWCFALQGPRKKQRKKMYSSTDTVVACVRRILCKTFNDLLRLEDTISKDLEKHCLKNTSTKINKQLIFGRRKKNSLSDIKN